MSSGKPSRNHRTGLSKDLVVCFNTIRDGKLCSSQVGHTNLRNYVLNYVNINNNVYFVQVVTKVKSFRFWLFDWTDKLLFTNPVQM